MKACIIFIFTFFMINNVSAQKLKFKVFDITQDGYYIDINKKLPKYSDPKAISIEIFCHGSLPQMNYFDSNHKEKVYDFYSESSCFRFAYEVAKKYNKSSDKKYLKSVCVHFDSEDDFKIYYDLNQCD